MQKDEKWVGGTGRYRITVRGRLSERFASVFEGMTLEDAPGATVLVGELADQAHLYGIIHRLRDLGVELVALEEVSCGDGSGPHR